MNMFLLAIALSLPLITLGTTVNIEATEVSFSLIDSRDRFELDENTILSKELSGASLSTDFYCTNSFMAFSAKNANHIFKTYPLNIEKTSDGNYKLSASLDKIDLKTPYKFKNLTAQKCFVLMHLHISYDYEESADKLSIGSAWAPQILYKSLKNNYTAEDLVNDLKGTYVVSNGQTSEESRWKDTSHIDNRCHIIMSKVSEQGKSNILPSSNANLKCEHL